jgi:hypothetical protein
VAYLQTFGELRLTDGQSASVRYPAKALVMLAYLYCSPDRQRSRQELARFLWNETGDHLADLNLRKLISRIRDTATAPDDQMLNFGPPFIRLNTEVMSADLDTFRTEEQPVAQLTAISDLVQQGFIPGLSAATPRSPVIRRLSHRGGKLRNDRRSKTSTVLSATRRNAQSRFRGREMACPSTLQGTMAKRTLSGWSLQSWIFQSLKEKSHGKTCRVEHKG